MYTYLKTMIKKVIYKMEITKQINIKNRTYYFYNDIIDLENFGIYNIRYITMKKIDDCKNINSVNRLDKNNNIFQTTRFNHTMILFKLTD